MNIIDALGGVFWFNVFIVIFVSSIAAIAISLIIIAIKL